MSLISKMRSERLTNRRVTLFVFKGLLSTTLLTYLLWETDTRHLFYLFYTIEPVYFLSATGLYVGCQYLSSFRWQLLLKGQGVFVPLNRLFSYYLVGMFFNNFLPTSAGGDVVKGYDLYRYSGKGVASFSTVLLERYLGLLAVVIIGLMVWTAGYSRFPDPKIGLFLGGVALGIGGGTWMAVSPTARQLFKTICFRHHWDRAEEVISGAYDAFGRIKASERVWTKALGLSFGIQLFNIVVYIILSFAMAVPVPWGYFFLFFPVVTLISMVPISLNGLGVREGTFVYLFSQIGAPSSQAIGLSLSWFFMVTAISLLGGVIFAVRR